MAQNIIIAILFLTACGYIFYLVRKSFVSKNCASGCNSCGVDLSKIEKQIERDKQAGRQL